MLSRRNAVGLLGASAIASATPSLSHSRSNRNPFLWGAATAAYQVEGNNINSDIWLLEALPNSPFAERSGDACDHYHRYDQDIALLAKLGLNSYRFGIEWARVEPDEGMFSNAALEHYGRMLDSCHRHGVTPVVTLHHFSSPRWFAAKGGFENGAAPMLFARYARRVVEALGDRIGWLCTINEANLSFGSNPKLLSAAAKAADTSAFSTFLFSNIGKSKPIVRDCHTAARAAIKAVRPTLPVGYTLAMDDVQDAQGVEGRAARLRSAMYDVWLESAKGDDFIGVQNYTRMVIGDRGPIPTPAEVPKTQIGQEFYPAALGGAVRYAALTAGVPVMVTESGVGIEDDAMRVRYIDEALASLAAVMRDGVDVRGYIHWSLLDNFEWLFGYRPKFGLVAVDRDTQKRTPKPSARHLGKLAQRKFLP
jgi:beta-glucosidase